MDYRTCNGEPSGNCSPECKYFYVGRDAYFCNKKEVAYTIPERLEGLNEYTAMNRYSRYGGGRDKKKNTDLCYLYTPKIEAETPCEIIFTWYGDMRRDPDNIAFAKKFILDAAVIRGVLPDDSFKYIHKIEDNFIKSTENKVEIRIIKE